MPPVTLGEAAPYPEAAPTSEAREVGAVYRQHAAYTFRCLRHLGVHENDLEDLVHDVFVVVSRKLASFEGRSQLTTWIHSICIRTASDYRQKAFRRREIPTCTPPESGTGAPLAEAQQLERQLLALLDHLTEDQRNVFVLYELQELSMREVAEATGTPLQTAYSRLHAARERLRQLVGDAV
jgi:RNA polymerase sigma-70 factor, ECF subfamily